MNNYNIAISRKLLSILIILLVSLSCKAQFAAPGTRWDYGREDPRKIEDHLTYVVSNDTLIAGNTFSKVVYDNKADLNAHTYYLQKEGTKTYYWNGIKRCLLFNTDVKKGDTLILDLYFYRFPVKRDTTITLQVRIDTVMNSNSNQLDIGDTSVTYKIRNISDIDVPGFLNYGFYTEKIIKSSGINCLLPEILLSVFLSDYSYYLRCYTSPTYNYRNKRLGDKPCNYTNVGIEEAHANSDITVYPNPAIDELTIDINNNPGFKNAKMQIFNLSGNVVKQFEINIGQINKIDLSDLTPGLYLIEFVTGNTKATRIFNKL